MYKAFVCSVLFVLINSGAYIVISYAHGSKSPGPITNGSYFLDSRGNLEEVSRSLYYYMWFGQMCFLLSPLMVLLIIKGFRRYD